MSKFLGTRNLVFKPAERFMVDLRNMDRDEKIDKINSFSDNSYRIGPIEGFINMLDSIMVEKGEWVVTYGE